MTNQNETNIHDLFEHDETLQKYIDLQTKKLTDRFEKLEEQIADHQRYNEQRQADLSNRLNTHTDQINRLQDFQKDSLRFQEAVKSMHEKTQAKIEREKENYTFLIDQLSQELRTKTTELEKFTTS